MAPGHRASLFTQSLMPVSFCANQRGPRGLWTSWGQGNTVRGRSRPTSSAHSRNQGSGCALFSFTVNAFLKPVASPLILTPLSRESPTSPLHGPIPHVCLSLKTHSHLGGQGQNCCPHFLDKRKRVMEEKQLLACGLRPPLLRASLRPFPAFSASCTEELLACPPTPATSKALLSRSCSLQRSHARQACWPPAHQLDTRHI